VPLEDTISMNSTSGFTIIRLARQKQRARFAGTLEKIQYLKDIGVTAVGELLPVTS